MPLPDTGFYTSYFDIHHVSGWIYRGTENRYSSTESLCGQLVSVGIYLDE